MGLDVRRLLEGARQAGHSNNEAVELGVAMGDNAAAGRDKLSLVIDQSLETLGLWIEQLIAVGHEVGGVDLDIPEDHPATAADLSRI